MSHYPWSTVPSTSCARHELLPFVAAINENCRVVMTSHILVPQLDRNNPATMSRVVLHHLLRRELGFSGVVVSDALDMAGASARSGWRRQPSLRWQPGGSALPRDREHECSAG